MPQALWFGGLLCCQLQKVAYSDDSGQECINIGINIDKEEQKHIFYAKILEKTLTVCYNTSVKIG